MRAVADELLGVWRRSLYIWAVPPDRDLRTPRFDDLPTRLHRAVLRAEAVVADAQAIADRVKRTQTAHRRVRQQSDEELARGRNAGDQGRSQPSRLTS